MLKAKKAKLPKGRKLANAPPSIVYHPYNSAVGRRLMTTKAKKNFRPRPAGQHRFTFRSLKKVSSSTLLPIDQKVTAPSQIFPFLNLPAELREKILIYALVIEDDIKIVDHRRKAVSYSLPTPTAFSKIFLLNRQIYREALPIAYGMNTFHFDDLMTFVHFFLNKFVSAHFVKNIRLELDQSSMAKPLGGFIDVFTLLNRKYNSFITEPLNGNNLMFLHLVLRRLTKVQHLHVKFTTLFNDELQSREYYASIFALMFLQQAREPTDKDRVTLDFTYHNPHFKYSQKHRKAPTKDLPKEVETSLIGTALAIMYLLHLRRH